MCQTQGKSFSNLNCLFHRTFYFIFIYFSVNLEFLRHSDENSPHLVMFSPDGRGEEKPDNYSAEMTYTQDHARSIAKSIAKYAQL